MMYEDEVTIADHFQAAGYSTGMFGKWHLGDEDAYQPGQRGFDRVFIHGAGGIGQRFSRFVSFRTFLPERL